jgi:hypothetical protein
VVPDEANLWGRDDGRSQDYTAGPARKVRPGALNPTTFLRDGLKQLAQELMDAEVTQLIGAGPYERTESRLNSRNGYREREWVRGRASSLRLAPSHGMRARQPSAEGSPWHAPIGILFTLIGGLTAKTPGSANAKLRRQPEHVVAGVGPVSAF